MLKSKNSVMRLARYRDVLNKLASMGFIKVFSNNLADATGVTPAQVRKDFSNFSILGYKKGGYVIQELLDRLNEIFGKNIAHKVIIVGVGNIGRALIDYKGFEKEGINIVAAFDIDSAKYDGVSKIPIMPMENLTTFIKENNIRIGIISVPDIAAQHIFNIMVASGVKGVLNFAPIVLKSSEKCVIHNVNLRAGLETVIYFVSSLEN